MPYNPSQNGLAKWMNRTIQEKVRSMLSNAKLTPSFWAKEVATAVHLINRSPRKMQVDKEQVAKMVWSGKQPLYLKVFGRKAYSHIPKKSKTKFE